MLIVWSLAYDTEKKIGTFSGNCAAPLALQIAQELVIADGTNRAIQLEREKDKQNGKQEQKHGKV